MYRYINFLILADTTCTLLFVLSASGDPELKGVVFERKDSAFLLRFLRARKFDVSRAVSLYTNYYQNRVTYSKVFEEFTAQSCEELLRSGIIHVLEHRMRSGPKVEILIGLYIYLLHSVFSLLTPVSGNRIHSWQVGYGHHSPVPFDAINIDCVRETAGG